MKRYLCILLLCSLFLVIASAASPKVDNSTTENSAGYDNLYIPPKDANNHNCQLNETHITVIYCYPNETFNQDNTNPLCKKIISGIEHIYYYMICTAIGIPIDSVEDFIKEKWKKILKYVKEKIKDFLSNEKW